MTRERMNQSPRPNKMLCKNYFDKARRVESARFMALPGIIDTSTMIQRGTDLGRCHICNISKAIWWYGAQRVGLCDVCYARESRSQKIGASCWWFTSDRT